MKGTLIFEGQRWPVEVDGQRKTEGVLEVWDCTVSQSAASPDEAIAWESLSGEEVELLLDNGRSGLCILNTYEPSAGTGFFVGTGPAPF